MAIKTVAVEDATEEQLATSTAIAELYDTLSVRLMGVDMSIAVPALCMAIESAAMSIADGDAERAVTFLEEIQETMAARLRAGGYYEEVGTASTKH